MSDVALTSPPFELGQSCPTQELTAGRYIARFARTEAELDAALRLRFEVFNLELNEGLEASYATQRDTDAFDSQCHHLLVYEKTNSQVIGVYRMQTTAMARAGVGFYASNEFDLQTIPAAMLEQSVEIGRACIDRDHRNTGVLFLLWRGLALYLQYMRKRYLFGCCSLTSQDPVEGTQVMDHLRQQGHLHPTLCLNPLSGFECYIPTTVPNRNIVLPRLFRTYLKYGAKVCSLPAIDRMFKTIDYLVMLDINELTPETLALFIPR